MSHEVLEGVVVCSGQVVDQLLESCHPYVLPVLTSTRYEVIIAGYRDQRVRKFLQKLLQQAAHDVDVLIVRESVVAFVQLCTDHLDHGARPSFPARGETSTSLVGTRPVGGRGYL